MEAFRTLYEMTLYSDFASSVKTIFHYNRGPRIKLPTLLLKECLEKAINPLEFDHIFLRSAYAGRVLAQSGQSTSIMLTTCAFAPAAEEAFVDGMLSKTDKNSGLTGLCLMSSLAFRSDQNLVRLLTSEYGPTEFSYLFPNSPYSDQVLAGVLNSPRLQSLVLCSENFANHDSYAAFLSSLKSTSLRKLAIQGWNSRHDVAFPVEMFQNLPLTRFALKEPTFHEAGWKRLLQEIPKCTTLDSLEFWYIKWWGSEDRDTAVVEFAMALAQFLKNNPNILTANTKDYMSDEYDDDYDGGDINYEVVYTTYIGPILEHNRLIKYLKTLKDRGNYKERGFLVAEAVGTRFATKVSCCYTILKANVDVLVSYLSSTDLPRGKKRNICSLDN